MAKASKSDDQLRQLAGVKDLASPDAVRAEIEKALKAKDNFVAAKAADLVRELTLVAVIPALVAAFAERMTAPEKSDKGCLAKVAIVRALHELNYDNTDVFEKGIAHIQMESTWGGKADSAIPLRELSAIALAALRHPKVLYLLLPLLADPAPAVRCAAARAIAAAGREEGQLLLRLKILSGDSDEDVTSECVSSLLQLGAEPALEFVARLLDACDPTTRSTAALAIGASHLRGAFDAVHRRWTAGVDETLAAVLLLAFATMRDERAMKFLLTLISEGPFKHALLALRALKSARPDERTAAAMLSAVEARDDAFLLAALRELG